MRGSILAVARLLTEVGFEFLAPDETIVPSTPLVIDGKTDITFESVFENRDNNEWPAASSPTWAGLMGYNGGSAHGSKGGFQKYASPPGFVHTSYNLLAGPKAHYNVLHCKRNGSGPCLGYRLDSKYINTYISRYIEVIGISRASLVYYYPGCACHDIAHTLAPQQMCMRPTPNGFGPKTIPPRTDNCAGQSRPSYKS